MRVLVRGNNVRKLFGVTVNVTFYKLKEAHNG